MCVVLCNFLISSSAREQWIDPHDMTIKPESGLKIKGKPASRDVNIDDVNNQASNCNCSSCIEPALRIHYQRTLSILLNAIEKNPDVNNQYVGVIHVNIATDDYNFLKAFVESFGEDVGELRRLNSILEKIFSETWLEKTSHNIAAWTWWFYFTFYNHTTGIVFIGLAIAWISYKLLKANLTLWNVVKTLFLFAWVVDFAFTWIHLIQVKLAEQKYLASNAPIRIEGGGNRKNR